MAVLDGILVVEQVVGIAGPYVGRLLADLGAQVVEFEGGSHGSEIAPWAIEAGGPLARHLSRGKRTASARLDSTPAAQLLARADVLVLGPDASKSQVDDLTSGYPSLVIVTITPWGVCGPWARRPASDLVVQAEAGAVGIHGRSDTAPYKSGGRLVEWAAGAAAAAAALAAVRAAKRTGRGDHIDVSLLAVAAFASVAFVDVRYQLEGRPPIERPARVIDAPSVERTADGWVCFATNTVVQISSFFEMIDRPDLLSSEWMRADYRMANIDAWNDIAGPWLASRTSEQVIKAAKDRRIPVAPVFDGAGLRSWEQCVALGLFGEDANGQSRPLSPFMFNGQRLDVSDAVTDRDQVAPTQVLQKPDRPFADLKVVDATTFFAGPVVGQILAYLGADVVHLESCRQIDGARGVIGPLAGSDQWWERSGMWHGCNRAKRSVTLDLTKPEGRRLAAELISRADVMVENFTPRVFERFELDHTGVRAVNPDIVHVRMPAFGLNGPWREDPGFAQTIEGVGGLAWRTGHPGDPPRVPRGPADPLSGWHAAVATLAGILHRDSTGSGPSIEAPMIGAIASTSAEMVVDDTDRAWGREGNRSSNACPEGVYRCAGEDAWVAISVTTPDQWTAFAQAIDRPELVMDLGGSIDALHQHADMLDQAISAWCATRHTEDVVDELVRAGIPSGAVRDPRLLTDHPQLRGFGYYEVSDHPVVGEVTVPTLPFRFASIDAWSTGRPPLLGEHNREVLMSELGCDETRYAALLDAGVIGSAPVGT